MPTLYRAKAPYSVLPFKALPAVDTWLIESGIGPSPDHLNHYHQLHGVHLVDAWLDGQTYHLLLCQSEDGSFVAKEFERGNCIFLKDTECDWVLRQDGDEAVIAQLEKNKYKASTIKRIDWDKQDVKFESLRSLYILSHECGYEPKYLKKAKALVKAEGGKWEEVDKWVKAQNPWEE